MIQGWRVTFFDIGSTKATQYGFPLDPGDGKRLVCCGDEPCKPCAFKYAKDCEWLLHEAFCLSSEVDIFEPYEKHHSTVKDAATLADKLGVRNLVLYHTEDTDLKGAFLMARKDALQGQKTASPRPFLKWAGGKSQLLSEIMPYYPFAEGRLTRYVEPFVGAGAVLFDILGSFELQSVYIGDCNTELVIVYVCMRD